MLFLRGFPLRFSSVSSESFLRNNFGNSFKVSYGNLFRVFSANSISDFSQFFLELAIGILIGISIGFHFCIFCIFLQRLSWEFFRRFLELFLQEFYQGFYKHFFFQELLEISPDIKVKLPPLYLPCTCTTLRNPS